MEISIKELLAGVVLLIIQAGLLTENHVRQRQAKRKAEIDSGVRDDAIRAELTQALVKMNDRAAQEIEGLRSKFEGAEAQHKLDKQADERRHQKDLEARDQVIRNLEATIIERLDQEEKDSKERDLKQANEREYYRKTINDMRDDTRDMMQITLKAQEQSEQAVIEKNLLAEDNRNLNVTVTGQREQIIQLTTQLHTLTEERNRLQQQLETLETLRQENAALLRTIESLRQEIADKDNDIARLQRELNDLRPKNVNPAMVLTAPESAITGGNPL